MCTLAVVGLPYKQASRWIVPSATEPQVESVVGHVYYLTMKERLQHRDYHPKCRAG
jgi:hypothetical protein